jgi:hypothetical protein
VLSLTLLSGCSAETIVDLLPVRADAAAGTDPPALDAAADGAGPWDGSEAAAPPNAGADGSLSSAPGTDGAVSPQGTCPGVAPGAPSINALYFGGSEARVEVANMGQLNLSTEFAVEAWVLLCSASGGPSIVSQYQLDSEDKFLGIDPALQLPESWFSLAIDGMPTVAARTALPVGSWHHLAVSAGSGTLQIFVDGQSLASASLVTPVANAASTLYIGSALRLGWAASIDGYIADVRISSNNRYPGTFTPAPVLAADSTTLALWPLDEGAGTVAGDRGPATLNGTIAGAAAWTTAPAR